MKSRVNNKTKNSKLLELIDGSYIGIIENVDDPNFEGRCKIRVFGVYGDKNDVLGKIPVEDLPYAYPHYELSFGSKDGAGRFSSPKTGANVRVIFENDIYHPRYFSIEELNPELKELLKENYSNFHSLIYDTDENLKIYYTKNSGFLIDLKESTINILPDGAIVLNHKGSSSTIEMRGNDIDIVTKNSINLSSPNNITINSNLVHVNGAETDVGGNPIYSNPNGEILMVFLKAFATAHDQKYPTTPGAMSGLLQSMESMILSKTVKTSP